MSKLKPTSLFEELAPPPKSGGGDRTKRVVGKKRSITTNQPAAISGRSTNSRQATDKKAAGFRSTQDLLSRYTTVAINTHVSQEFQDFGYRLAVALDDLAHKSLYIKMAKEHNRGILEQALAFVTDANAKNKARLFMWKIGQLKNPPKQPT